MMERSRKSGLSHVSVAVFVVGFIIASVTFTPQTLVGGKINTVEPDDITSQAPPPRAHSGGGISLHLAAGTFDPLLESLPIPDFPQVQMEAVPIGESAYYIVQMSEPITDEGKSYLTEAGCQIFDYIPEYAFIVKMDETARSAVERYDFVRWIGPYQAGYRVSPNLLGELSPPAVSRPMELVVVTFRGEDIELIADRLQALGGNVLDVTSTTWKGKIKVEIDSAEIQKIAAVQGVKWIEEAPVWRLFNDVAREIMNVDPVWSPNGLFGQGQVVAVADTGLDGGSTSPPLLHDDFEDDAGNSRVIQLIDRVGDGANDVDGHGTHVAGSVLGNGANSGGSYAGVAPEAQLVFQAVQNNFWGWLEIPSDLNILFNEARTAGAHIHTNSWGASVFGAYTSASEDVDENTWDHKNFTILFSAGNDGIDANGDGVIDLDSIGAPATAKNCITVGATENNRPSGSSPSPGYNFAWGTGWPGKYPANPINSDHVSDDPEGMAAFSSRGPADDGRTKPDVVAPGTNVISTLSSQGSPFNLWGSGGLSGGLQNFYAFSGGTSMSTPLVAGAAALVREFYTNQGYTPSSALIKATLINGAADMSGQYAGTEVIDGPRPNQAEGWGRVDLGNSLFPSTRGVTYWDITPGLTTGGTDTYVIDVSDQNEPLRVTLVWTDYPGSPIANGGLVNDLDLSVIDPLGTTHYPNGGVTFDRVNNVLGIDIDTPLLGEYTINIQGFNIPQGPQPYGLVISGGFALVSNLLLEWDSTLGIRRGPNRLGEYTIRGNLEIENQGAQETEIGTLRVYLSDNDTFEEGSDSLINEAAVPRIAARERISKGFSGRTSLPTEEVVRYLIAVVEAGSEKPEPHVQVLDVGVDFTAVWNLPIEITGPDWRGRYLVNGTFSVLNARPLPSPRCEIQVFYSNDPIWDAGDTPVFGRPKGARRLSSVRSKTVRLRHKFDEAQFPGYLFIVVDMGDAVPEIDETNNVIGIGIALP